MRNFEPTHRGAAAAGVATGDSIPRDGSLATVRFGVILILKSFSTGCQLEKGEDS